jgi:hypothetical protein
MNFRPLMEAAQKEGLTIFWILVSSALVEITQRRLHFLKRAAQPVNKRGMCALNGAKLRRI